MPDIYRHYRGTGNVTNPSDNFHHEDTQLTLGGYHRGEDDDGCVMLAVYAQEETGGGVSLTDDQVEHLIEALQAYLDGDQERIPTAVDKGEEKIVHQDGSIQQDQWDHEIRHQNDEMDS